MGPPAYGAGPGWTGGVSVRTLPDPPPCLTRAALRASDPLRLSYPPLFERRQSKTIRVSGFAVQGARITRARTGIGRLAFPATGRIRPAAPFRRNLDGRRWIEELHSLIPGSLIGSL